MAWTTPATVVADSTELTASLWNEQVRDNAQHLYDTMGLAHIVTQSFSASTNLNFNECFSDTFINYRIIARFSTASVSQEVKLRMRLGTTDDTSANYHHVRTANVAGTLAGLTSFSQTEGGIGNYSNGTVSGFQMELWGPKIAAPTVWRSFTTQNVGTSIAAYDYTGNHNVSTAYDGCTMFPAFGNFSGAISIYGYRY